MKTRRSSVILAVLIATYSIGMADSGQQTSPPKPPITLVKKNGGASTIRPKAPDRQVITCAYDGVALLFNLVLPEGAAIIHVTDETLITTLFEIDTTPLEATITIGSIEGACTIEMETDKNNYYCGTIE